MSKIVQLEELRDYITADGMLSWDGHKTTWVRQDSLLIYLDAIEREVAERYTELPLDADGVPIHVGDEITLPSGKRDTVRFITYRMADVVFNERGWVPSLCTLSVKPRTLEDVLQCAGVSVAAIEDVAAEIRELMEVGE